MSTKNIINLIVLAVLLALSAFFSSAETAMTTVNKLRIKSLAESGNSRAVIMEKILAHSAKMLSAILIGNNIVNLYASSLATSLAIDVFGSSSVGIATGILTLLVLIFGEITPKNLAAVRAEKLSLSYAPVIWALMWIMTPVISVINALSGLLMRLFHATPGRKDVITEDDLRTFVDASRDDGAIQVEEHKMINNVFDLDESCARDIMVPGVDMVCINEDDSYEKIREIYRTEKYSRLPVYRHDRDHIIGILNIKDFMFASPEKFRVSRFMYQPHFTFETKKTSDLLMEMRRSSIAMSIVLDEYGAVSGLVTLEDILEELVGEIHDEYDADEDNQIRQISGGDYIIEGTVKLDDINDMLGTSFESEDYDSIGGYVTGLLDQVPAAGDTVTSPQGHTLRVLEMDHQRVARVRLHLSQPEDTGADAEKGRSGDKARVR